MAKILFIEPDAELNAKVTQQLQESGHTVDTFHNPMQAVNSAQTWRYDLMITEYKMPGLKGTEIFRQIFDLQLIPVIITSESPADMLDETMSRLPIPPRLLKKPYMTIELLQQIDKLLMK